MGGNQATAVAKATKTNWVKTFVRNAALNVFGFFLAIGGLSVFAIFVRSSAQWLAENTSPWLALAFVVTAGAGWAYGLSWIKPDHLRNPEGKILPGPAFGFVVAVTAVWIYVFATLSYILMKLGAVSYAFTGSPDAVLPDLGDAYSWYMLDLIPGLDINTALDWSPDVVLSGGWRGVILILFRVVIVFQVFALSRTLVKESKDPKAA